MNYNVGKIHFKKPFETINLILEKIFVQHFRFDHLSKEHKFCNFFSFVFLSRDLLDISLGLNYFNLNKYTYTCMD